jgi:hypothetical protein
MRLPLENIEWLLYAIHQKLTPHHMSLASDKKPTVLPEQHIFLCLLPKQQNF